MSRNEEIAAELLKLFDLDDEHRAALMKRLGQVLEFVELQKAGKAFKRPPADGDDLDNLKKALTRTRACIEKLEPATLGKVNRPLVEGDIPLLDELSTRARGGQTAEPQRIAEVLHHLAGALLAHLETVEVIKSPPGPHGDFSKFLAAELSYIYSHAAKQLPTKCTDRDTGKQYGPFHAFVSEFLAAAGIRRPGADHVVDLATPQPDPHPIRII